MENKLRVCLRMGGTKNLRFDEENVMMKGLGSIKRRDVFRPGQATERKPMVWCWWMRQNYVKPWDHPGVFNISPSNGVYTSRLMVLPHVTKDPIETRGTGKSSLHVLGCCIHLDNPARSLDTLNVPSFGVLSLFWRESTIRILVQVYTQLLQSLGQFADFYRTDTLWMFWWTWTWEQSSIPVEFDEFDGTTNNQWRSLRNAVSPVSAEPPIPGG